MKYLCCNCKTEFQAEDAIDGYEDGYKAGFLCPKCKANITSDGMANIMAWEKRKGRRLFTVALGLMVLGHYFWGHEFEVVTGIPWFIVGGLTVLAAVVAIYALNKDDPETKYLHTKYIDKSMLANTKAKHPWES